MFILRQIQSWFSSAPEPKPKSRKHKIELTELQEKVRDQMEFYLSPSNVESQSFMKSLITERDDRFCPIERFFTFNRLAALGCTFEDVVRACEASSELELDSTKTLVRTIIPFKPDPRRDFRTIHVEGLAEDETLDTLQEFFRGIFPRVLRVEMRRKNLPGGDKVFSGEANVEVETEEIAQEACQKGINYKGVCLQPVILAEFKRGMVRGRAKKAEKPPKAEENPSPKRTPRRSPKK